MVEVKVFATLRNIVGRNRLEVQASTVGELMESNKNEIYREWIKTYTSQEYIELTNKLIKTFDKYAGREDYDRLKRAFITSSRYEWMFWDMSYKMEKWPIP